MTGLRAAVCAATLAVVVACGGHRLGASSGVTTGAAPSSPGASQAGSGAAADANAGDWPEFDYTPQRTGVGPADTGIDAGNLGSLGARIVHIDGTVDSSAVEVHGVSVAGRTRDVIVVTTTYGKTIAIDPGTGQKLWEFTPGDIRSYVGSAQVTTATPIVDPDGGFVYAASPDGFVRKLALSTGQQVWATRVTFDPTHEKIASALNVTGGDVIVTTGGYYGDTPPYQGHVVLINRATGRITAVWNSLCSDRHRLIDPPSSCHASDAAIWAREGAVVEPGSGRILVATGNAPFNGSTDWGDSVLELSPNAGSLLHNWTPTDQSYLNNSDLDLGSTAPALLPEVGGLRLAVQGGKDGILRLLNLGRLDGTAGPAGVRTGGQLQQIAAPGNTDVYTAPAVWSRGGPAYVFVADDAGTAAYLLGANHRLRIAWQNGTSGTSPVVAGGLLYIYDELHGRLNVYSPGSGRLVRSLGAGGGHWNSPIIVGGRIILPVGNYMDHATSGEIFIFHLPGR